MSGRKKTRLLPIDRKGLIRLTLAVFSGLWLVRMVLSMVPMPATVRLLLRAAGQLLLGGGAILLCRRFCLTDERRRQPEECLSLWQLPAGYLYHLILMGVTLPFPVLFVNALFSAVGAKIGIVSAASVQTPGVLYVPALVVSGLLTPICEELFFRGWLSVLYEEKPDGTRIPDAEIWCFSAALFALSHGIDVMLPVRFLLGLLLCKLMREMHSLLASMAVHALYNTVLLTLDAAGLYGCFASPHPMGALVTILASFAALYQIRWVFQGRLTGIRPVELSIRRLTVWEIVLVAAAGYLLLLSLFLGVFL